MSMIGNLARIPEATRRRLHEQPSEITQYLYPGAPKKAVQPRAGILGRLFGGKQTQREIPLPPTESLPEHDSMDLDKAWHGLHFLFTGSDWSGDFPQGFL